MIAGIKERCQVVCRAITFFVKVRIVRILGLRAGVKDEMLCIPRRIHSKVYAGMVCWLVQANGSVEVNIPVVQDESFWRGDGSLVPAPCYLNAVEGA